MQKKSPNQQIPPRTNSKLALLGKRQDASIQQMQKFQALAADPNLSPKAAGWYRNLARSAAASVKLGEKALDYETPHRDPEVERRLRVYRLFRLPLPLI
jgi:hypothetical protein